VRTYSGAHWLSCLMSVSRESERPGRRLADALLIRILDVSLFESQPGLENRQCWDLHGNPYLPATCRHLEVCKLIWYGMVMTAVQIMTPTVMGTGTIVSHDYQTWMGLVGLFPGGFLLFSNYRLLGSIPRDSAPPDLVAQESISWVSVLEDPDALAEPSFGNCCSVRAHWWHFLHCVALYFLLSLWLQLHCL
jgi:hypothetical protein